MTKKTTFAGNSNSQYDEPQIIKEVHDYHGQSLRTLDTRSLVDQYYTHLRVIYDAFNKPLTVDYYRGVSARKTVFNAVAAGPALDGTYFTVSSAPDNQLYAIWFNLDGGSSQPVVPNAQYIEISINTGDSAEIVAFATKIVLDLYPDQFIATRNAANIEIKTAGLGECNASTVGTSPFVFTQTAGTQDLVTSVVLSYVGDDPVFEGQVLKGYKYDLYSGKFVPVLEAFVDSVGIGDDDGDKLDINPDGSINSQSNTHDGVGNPITSSQTPNGTANRLLHTQTPDTLTGATALSALNSTVAIPVEGLNSVGFQLNSGTLTGILVAESSVDGGTNWATVPFYDPVNSAVLTSLTFTNPNATKIYSVIPIGGSSHVRVRVFSYTSGSATALLRATQIAGSAGAITAAAFGNVTNNYPAIAANTPTLVLSANVNRKYVYISNSSAATVRIQFYNSTGLNGTTGLIILSNSYYEISGDRLFTGEIYAFCTSGITLSVTEGVP